MSCPLKTRMKEDYVSINRSAYDKAMLDTYNQKVFGDSYRAPVWPVERTNYDKLMNQRMYNYLHNKPYELPTEQQLQANAQLTPNYAVECFTDPTLTDFSLNKEPSKPTRSEMAFLAPRTDFDKAMNARFGYAECYGECAGGVPASVGLSLNDPNNPYSYNIRKV